MKRFELDMLNDEQVKERYQVEISKSSVALENWIDVADISNAWGNTTRENINILPKKERVHHYRLKQFENVQTY
jgi:hypothetical protein